MVNLKCYFFIDEIFFILNFVLKKSPALVTWIHSKKLFPVTQIIDLLLFTLWLIITKSIFGPLAPFSRTSPSILK